MMTFVIDLSFYEGLIRTLGKEIARERIAGENATRLSWIEIKEIFKILRQENTVIVKQRKEMYGTYDINIF